MDSKALAVLLSVFFLSFLAQVPAVFAAECGNGTCEIGENACTCTEDCGTCGGDVPGQTCKAYACVLDICRPTIIPNCCGNDLCESEETYGNCPGDCLPTELTLTVLGPMEDEYYFRGELVPLKLSITADGRNVAGADVNVTGFFGTMKMYNDGAHGDDKIGDKVYGNVVFIPSDHNKGVFEVRFFASFLGLDDNIVATLEVNPSLELDLPLRDTYRLGDIIDVSGSLLKKGQAVVLPIDVNIFSASSPKFQKTIYSSENGSFGTSYHTSLLDKTGDWTVTVYAVDAANNFVRFEHPFTVREPKTMAFLSINFTKEFEESYQRGGILTLIGEVFDDDGSKVSGAEVTVTSPLGDGISLSESAEGQYSGFYTLGYDLPVGLQHFEVAISKEDAAITYEGSGGFDVTVEETIVDVELLAPKEGIFRAGDNLVTRVRLSYPDGSAVDQAEVTAILNGREIVLEAVEPTVYEKAFYLEEEDIGLSDVFITVSDPWENRGFASFTVEISGSTILYDIQRNLLLILLIVIIVVPSILYLYSVYGKRVEFSGLVKKKAELLEAEKTLQTKYFELGLIDKEEYEREFNKMEKKLKEVEVSLQDLRRKAAKKRSKKKPGK